MILQDYDIFLNRIQKLAKTHGRLLRVVFELTYRCNFKCKHCYIPDSFKLKKRELTTKQVLLLLKQLKRIGCFYLGFTGGEPFIREDILEILHSAQKYGFSIVINTNGSFIDRKIANKLKLLKLNKIDITIPAISRLAFENITGITGSQAKVFYAIKYLYKNGIPLGFKSCLLKDNKNEIEKIAKFAMSLGASYRLDDYLMPRLDGSMEPYKYRWILRKLMHNSGVNQDSCDMNSKIKYSPFALTKNNNKEKRDILFPCGVGKTQAAITPTGELKMCLMIQYPLYAININQKEKRNGLKKQGKNIDLKESWERLKELVARIKPDKEYQCNKCTLFAFCYWCPAKSWLSTGSFNRCIPLCRSRAKNIQLLAHRAVLLPNR